MLSGLSAMLVGADTIRRQAAHACLKLPQTLVVQIATEGKLVMDRRITPAGQLKFSDGDRRLVNRGTQRSVQRRPARLSEGSFKDRNRQRLEQLFSFEAIANH